LEGAWLTEVAGDPTEGDLQDDEEEEDVEEDAEADDDSYDPDELKVMVADYWRARRVNRADHLETREPWPFSGGDVGLAAEVIMTASFFEDVCGEVEECEGGVMVNAIVEAVRGSWLVRTVVRREDGEWRVDPNLTVERTASLYRRYQQINPPYTAEETARGRAMQFWQQVGRHDTRRAAQFVTGEDSGLEMPKFGHGQADEFFWFIDEREFNEGVMVRVLMNTHDDQRMLHTVMVERDGLWHVDFAKTMQQSGFAAPTAA
jgi:hypothetical protein